MRYHLKRNMNRYLLTIFLFIGLAISTTGVIAYIEPIIEIDPEVPTPGSKVTFTSSITNNGKISNVRLIVKECKSDDLCYSDSFNESMKEKEMDIYEVEITLRHDTATYIQYHVEYMDNEIWVKSDSVKLNLKIESNNGNSNSGNGTPGFELISFLVIISTFLIIYRRKRF